METTTVRATCPLCGAESTATHADTRLAEGIAALGQRYHYTLAHGELATDKGQR